MRMGLLVLASCTGVVPDTGSVPLQATPTDRVAMLSPAELANRASMVLRGVRPTPEELAGATDASAVAELVDHWLDSPEIGEVVKDMHAEWWLVRNDIETPLPSRGPLEGVYKQRILSSTQEAPLRFVEEVVSTGLPYTTLVTADWTMADPIVADIYGLEHDAGGSEWQRTTWADGRPVAGILSDSEIWRRHVSNGNNAHRSRADFVAKAFLCADFSSRDIPLEAGLDMSDEVPSPGQCARCRAAWPVTSRSIRSRPSSGATRSSFATAP